MKPSLDSKSRTSGRWLLLRTLCAAAAVVVSLAGCMPNTKQIRASQATAASLQDHSLSCHRDDHCAAASALYQRAAVAMQQSTTEQPRHVVLSLETGRDALLARVHLIRAAQSSIEVQSFIFSEDDAGFLILQELLGAARRGVKVRVLLDQLFALTDERLLAALAQAHVNFEMRLYNPTFGDASTGRVEFVAGILCCFTRFNQRMHNKTLLVDGVLGITGGRNYQERYFDWDPQFNYRDRDVLVGGPVVQDMVASFDDFWTHPRSVPIAALRDVRRWLRTEGTRVTPVITPRIRQPERIATLRSEASTATVIDQVLVQPLFDVGKVEYLSDSPDKAFDRTDADSHRSSQTLRDLVSSARAEVVLQTPYLVLSRPARKVFRELQQREPAPRVQISTNSLAATDAFPVYALSHKYKRTYLREMRFEIHEYKPFPASAPIVLEDAEGLYVPVQFARSESARAFGSASRRTLLRGPLPLKRLGLRMGLHAKSMVIDGRIAAIGSHNFDPRSDHLNTEAVLLIHDRAFAEDLRQTLLFDMAPQNAWTIAPRPRPAILSGLNYSLGKLSEKLPLFDIWPWRYATSYEINPGCEPRPPLAADFAECYTPVGDFPEVALPFKGINTRILTAFGAGLAPIL
ncbi:MAG: Major cardiolipin synthase ClsA [Alphaproteobacteria bacterium ADurb.BinA280]|jgi:putative cardiolipin synthase|nr:MAG: Major cardiolipin synthase ClsA [Alphaproteobacteria bacterium ADurb.BinA280]